MDRFDRIFRLHGLLSNRRTPISLKHIMDQLVCSKATANRMIETLRDNLNAPLEYSRDHNGYFYNQDSTATPYELPGLWFSSEELHGLLICQRILQDISPGVLSRQIEALQQRINVMLSREHSPQPVIADKIYFVAMSRRMHDDSQFKRIAAGLFSDKRMYIHYRARGQNRQSSERTISGQKLVFYRDNWYLLAHCHWRQSLRIFSIDSVESVQILSQDAKPVSERQQQEFLQSSYGIFTGKAEYKAVLEFTASRANWVADEHWHEEQQGEWLKNGRYRLRIPFGDSRELIMDILKYGPDVKVIDPPFLKQAVKQQIDAMQRLYRDE